MLRMAGLTAVLNPKSILVAQLVNTCRVLADVKTEDRKERDLAAIGRLQQLQDATRLGSAFWAIHGRLLSTRVLGRRPSTSVSNSINFSSKSCNPTIRNAHFCSCEPHKADLPTCGGYVADAVTPRRHNRWAPG